MEGPREEREVVIDVGNWDIAERGGGMRVEGSQEMANLELHVYLKWSGYRVSVEGGDECEKNV